jgi:hypothetical protein
MPTGSRRAIILYPSCLISCTLPIRPTGRGIGGHGEGGFDEGEARHNEHAPVDRSGRAGRRISVAPLRQPFEQDRYDQSHGHNCENVDAPTLISIHSRRPVLSSSLSPIRRAMQTISKATPRTRLSSGSNRSPLRNGVIGMRACPLDRREHYRTLSHRRLGGCRCR